VNPQNLAFVGRVRRFALDWIVTAVAVLVATQLVPGLDCDSWGGLAVAALVLGLLNASVKPVLTILSLPLVLLTLGLFLWVINALLLLLVDWLVPPFQVSGFASALGGAAVISIVSALFGGWLRRRSLTPPPSPRPSSSSSRRGPPDGQGPVIDV
jgi:putative membrane protein